MKIAFFGNNRLAFDVVAWLKRQGEEVVALGVHPAETAAFRTELIEASGCEAETIMEGSEVNSERGRQILRRSGCELLLSVGFGVVLRPEVLRIPARGCLNLHTAYLPYGRGSNPNVWSIVQQTPAGATLHAMDEGVDTGQIISQRAVEVRWEDTGGTLYVKLLETAFQLFVETWPAIVRGTITPVAQWGAGGAAHRDRDLANLDRIELDKRYTARALINILRARTFPPYQGAYFIDRGVRYQLSLTITTGGPV